MGGGGEAGLPVLRLITDHYGFAFESFYAQSFGARSPWGAVSSIQIQCHVPSKPKFVIK